MNRNITGENVLAGRFYLEMTQAELSIALGIVGITTVNRWENGHSVPSGAWAKHIDAYFTKRINKGWRHKTRTYRFRRLLEVRYLAARMCRKVRIRPSDTTAELSSLCRALHTERRERSRKKHMKKGGKRGTK